MPDKPTATIGLRHVALYVKNLAACVDFYTNLLGMQLVWQPDEDNYYLSSGHDNLALHRAVEDFAPPKQQHLDHIGFFLTQAEQVDEWYQYLNAASTHIVAKPKDHRDGTRSFYCKDPDGNIIQMIYYPLPQT